MRQSCILHKFVFLRTSTSFLTICFDFFSWDKDDTEKNTQNSFNFWFKVKSNFHYIFKKWILPNVYKSSHYLKPKNIIYFLRYSFRPSSEKLKIMVVEINAWQKILSCDTFSKKNLTSLLFKRWAEISGETF